MNSAHHNANNRTICPISIAGENYQQTMNVPVGQSAYSVDYGASVYQMNGQYFGNLEAQQYISQKFLDSSIKMKEAEFKHFLELQKEEFIFQKRNELEDKKMENSLKREEGMELRKRKREMASYAIFENAEGYLCLEVHYLGGEKDYSKPVINRPHLRAIRICNIESKEMEALIVEADCFLKPIVLHAHNLSVKELVKALERSGITLAVSREKRSMVWELIFGYLLDKANEMNLPDSLGWYQTANEWKFADDEARTIKGVKEGKFND